MDPDVKHLIINVLAPTSGISQSNGNATLSRDRYIVALRQAGVGRMSDLVLLGKTDVDSLKGLTKLERDRLLALIDWLLEDDSTDTEEERHDALVDFHQWSAVRNRDVGLTTNDSYHTKDFITKDEERSNQSLCQELKDLMETILDNLCLKHPFVLILTFVILLVMGTGFLLEILPSSNRLLVLSLWISFLLLVCCLTRRPKSEEEAYADESDIGVRYVYSSADFDADSFVP